MATKKIQNLLKKHDEQYLLANISIVEEQVKKGNVSNVVGYLLKAFQDDFSHAKSEQLKRESEKIEHQEMEQKKVEAKIFEEKEQRRAFDKWK